ncbi:sugar O-acetyltransferase [Celeribacter ethanolicus]|uniref:sugar O-acetyltransferase n=1 Tax=Celeribacter ethanolicus TaxID=1758178 RepID=UPI00082DF0A0|nr:sugar O-acetyltransferase [Celeribacter ethanolicus]
MTSELDKMRAGDWYCSMDPEIDAIRTRVFDAVHRHNMALPSERGNMHPALREVIAAAPESARIEGQFHLLYGENLFLGEEAFLNVGCVVLDSGRVEIGARTMIGPKAQIYCADHHRDPVLRGQLIERALPVTISQDVWIGGGAIVLPGVSIGGRAIVGAGAVVTKNVAPGARVVGNPAREI